MSSKPPHPVDASLTGWIEAYGRLKAAQTRVKTAGPKSTLMMRQDVDRLRRSAEHALRHLQTDFDAARSRNVESSSPRQGDVHA